MKLPGLGGWSDDPLWASFYDWTVEHPVAGGLVWGLGMQTDLRRLYTATGEISTLPAGSRVLDVPCGGGVALRGLTPGQGIEYVAADIAQTMLDRTMDAARERGVADQVVPRVADVGDLPFGDTTSTWWSPSPACTASPTPDRGRGDGARGQAGRNHHGSAVLTNSRHPARTPAPGGPPGRTARPRLHRHPDHRRARGPRHRRAAARAVRCDRLLPGRQGLIPISPRGRRGSGACGRGRAGSPRRRRGRPAAAAWGAGARLARHQPALLEHPHQEVGRHREEHQHEQEPKHPTNVGPPWDRDGRLP